MSYPPQPPYGMPQYGYGYPALPPNHPQATTILVLGILGVTCCGLCAPVAWVMGHSALKEIRSSGGAIGGRGQVMAGYVCGIIGTLVMALYAAFMVLGFVLGWGDHPAQ